MEDDVNIWIVKKLTVKFQWMLTSIKEVFWILCVLCICVIELILLICKVVQKFTTQSKFKLLIVNINNPRMFTSHLEDHNNI